MAISSRTFAPFRSIVEELQGKLKGADVGVSRTAELLIEGQRLLETFRTWSKSPPTDEERVRTIERVMDFSRQVNEFLTRTD